MPLKRQRQLKPRLLLKQRLSKQWINIELLKYPIVSFEIGYQLRDVATPGLDFLKARTASSSQNVGHLP
jgi:hypothetical protein